MDRFAKKRGPLLAASVAVLTCGLIAGCGGGGAGEDLDATDNGRIQVLIGEVNGAAGEPDGVRWERIMLDPEAIGKSQRKPYAATFFFADKNEVTIDGDTATAQVAIEVGGEQKGTAEWTAEKVDGEWKLKDIPLPEGISAESGS